MENIFLDESLKSLPRLLSLLDRNPFSKNYGCLDRDYWHYRIASDFPCATFQAGAYPLALAFLTPAPGNIYYGKSQIKEYIEAALKFWTKAQHKDGSFSEWYPFEYSHVATAFSTFYASEVVLKMADRLDPAVKALVKPALIKAGLWLANNIDINVLNHSAGALAALQNIVMISADPAAAKAVEKYLNAMADHQSSEGWFKEYGGADVGYLSVSLDFLTRFYEKTQNPRALAMIVGVINFLKFFVHPDLSVGGEYGTRNTKYLLPSGLVKASAYVPAAREILCALSEAVQKGAVVTPQGADDRYFTLFFLPSFLGAGLALSAEPPAALTAPNTGTGADFEKDFKQAGIFVKRNAKYHLIVNYKKNGMVKLFDRAGRLVYSDTGYFAEFSGGKKATSQWFLVDRPVVVRKGEEVTAISIRSPFVRVGFDKRMTAAFWGLRVVLGVLGPVSLARRAVDKAIKHFGIKKNVPCPLFLEREILISEDEVLIKDRVSKRTHKRLTKCCLTSKLSALHVPSSRYYVANELDLRSKENFAERLNTKSSAEFEYKPGPF